MAIYGTAMQSVGSLVQIAGAKRQAKQYKRLLRENAENEQREIYIQTARVNASNIARRAKSGIGGPVLQSTEFANAQEANAAANAVRERLQAELSAVETKKQADVYAGLIGMTVPWIAYQEQQKRLDYAERASSARVFELQQAIETAGQTTILSNDIIKSRLSVLFDSNERLQKRLDAFSGKTALDTGIPQGVK
tara:strand:- start:9196 stop:9777 length:582 start_codon:yes stop_codon:yes gene_type:complete